MDTWLPKPAAQELPRWFIERNVRRILRAERCPWHPDGTVWLLKFGWYPSAWEIYANCCMMLRERAKSDVYWELVGLVLAVRGRDAFLR
jgi:hypothetical protein